MSQFTLLLHSRQCLMDILAGPDKSPADVRAMIDAAKEWGAATPHKLESLLRATVKRIVVHDKSVIIEIDRPALRRALLGASGDDAPPGTHPEDPVVIEVDAEWKRCGGEVRLILPPDSPGVRPHPAPSLIRAISRAHDWVDRIVRGEVANQRALARETGLDDRYISRILPLAFLAPDLTEAILEGKQAAHLSLDGCLGNIPADWNQQRVQLLGK